MQNIFLKLLIIVFFAVGAFSCEKCNECSNDLSSRFRFVDTLRNEIYVEPDLVKIIDLENNDYPIIREVVQTDTFYLADFRPLTPELESPDTVLLLYNNNIIDSVIVNHTFSSDSRCCTNTLMVGSLFFFEKNAAKRILPAYYIYDIIID